MSLATGIIDGDVRVTSDGEDVSGIVSGNVTIAPGIRTTVSGIVKGNVVVEAGATATITGLISGRIDDRGGTVRVTGIVRG